MLETLRAVAFSFGNFERASYLLAILYIGVICSDRQAQIMSVRSQQLPMS